MFYRSDDDCIQHKRNMIIYENLKLKEFSEDVLDDICSFSKIFHSYNFITYDFKFQKNEKKLRMNKNKNNLIYFNPPFNASVKTNIGKQFSFLLTNILRSKEKIIFTKL